MYVKDGAAILADGLRILGGILSRPVVLFAFRPLKVIYIAAQCLGTNSQMKQN